MNNFDFMRTVRWAARLGGALGTIVVYVVFDIELAILVLAGVVLFNVILTLFSSVQALTGETGLSLDEALSLAVPTVEEEQKRAVLRTLKDLEYERSVGKISDRDYRELVATYRARAKQLIQAVDESTEHSRQRAEKLLEKRLKSEASEPDNTEVTSEKSEPEKSRLLEPVAEEVDSMDSVEYVAPISSSETRSSYASPVSEEVSTPVSQERILCSECDTDNEVDARFCKSCGSALEQAS